MAKILLAQHLSNWLALTVYTYWMRTRFESVTFAVWIYRWHFFFSMIFLRKNLKSEFFVFSYKLLHGLSWLTEKSLLILSWQNCGFDFKVKAVYIHTHGKSSKTYVSKCQWYSSMFSYRALDTHECAHTHICYKIDEKNSGELMKIHGKLHSKLFALQMTFHFKWWLGEQE